MIFGRTTKGATSITIAADTKIVTRVMFKTAGRLPKVTVLLDGNGGAAGAISQAARAVVYGSDDKLIAQGNEVVVAVGQAKGWVDFTFTNIEGGVLLPSAGAYDIGIHAGASSNVIRVWV